MTEFSRYYAYITYVPQTICFLPRYYRAPLLIGFGRGCPRKTKLWNIIRLDMAYCPSLCKFEIILTLCFLFNFNSQFNSVLNSTFIVIQQYSWYFLFMYFRLKHHYQIKVITFDVVFIAIIPNTFQHTGRCQKMQKTRRLLRRKEVLQKVNFIEFMGVY
jgi:hypothetical protein